MINNLIYIIVLLFPFVDLLTSFSVRYSILPFSPGVVFRGIIFVICFVYPLIRKKKSKKLYIYYSVFVLYGILKLLIVPFSNYYVEIINICKYWYLPFVLIFLSVFPLDYKKLTKFTSLSILIYDIGIIIPLVTGSAFSSYEFGNAGIVGWFYAANEIGALISLGIVVLYLNLIYSKHFWLNAISIFISMISLSFVGTKVATFSLILSSIIILILFMIKYKCNFKEKRVVLSVIYLILSFAIVFNNSTTLNTLSRININSKESNKVIKNKNTNAKNTIDNKSIINTNKTNNISTDKPTTKKETKVEKKEITFMGTLLSGRQRFLKDTYHDYHTSNIYHKLFGIGFVNNEGISKKTIELDFFDVFFGYGAIGFLLYFAPIVYIFIVSFTRKVKQKLISSVYFISLWGFALGMAIAFLAGHVLGAPSVSFFLAYFLAFCLSDMENKKCQK